MAATQWFLIVILCLPGTSSAMTSPLSDESDCRAKAEFQVAAGNLAEAASTLEAGAARLPDGAGLLFREAAWLRERRGEIGQALLDYRAMLKSPGSSADPDMSRHIAYLSLLLGRGQDLAALPIAEELKRAGLYSNWTRRRDVPNRQAVSNTAMEVPGGIDLLARTIGTDPISLKSADGARRFFSIVLNASPNIRVDDLQINPLRVAVLEYLKDYSRLTQFLEKEKLLPLDYEVAHEPEIVFPLLGSDADIARARKVLAFFGVDYRLKRTKDGQLTGLMQLKRGEKASERQSFLHDLGVDLQDRKLRQVRLPTGTDRMPVLLGSEVWDRMLPAKNGSLLLERMIANPAAMRLYLGLSSCSEATRDGLAAALAPGDLLKYSDVLLVFGSVMDFRDGKLWLPGSAQGWERLFQVPRSDPSRFFVALFSRNGRGLMLYSALAEAPVSVSGYVTSSPEMMSQLYNILAPYDSWRLINIAALLERQDLGRVFRLMKADRNGLAFNADGVSAVAAQPGAPGPDARQIENLLEPANVTYPDQIFSPLSSAELFQFIRRMRPRMLTGESIPALIRDRQQTPIFMDLVWDIDPNPRLISKYMNYCSGLAAEGTRGWNINRTRSSQSLFFLISALCREGALTRNQASKLLEDSLEALEAPSEAAFAERLAVFLAGELIPQITRGNAPQDGDPILRSLSGERQVLSFGFEDRRMQADLSAYRLHRMEQTIDRQTYTSLPVILDIYAALGKIDAATQDLPAALHALAEKLRRLQSAEFPPEMSASHELIAQTDLEDLKRDVERRVFSPTELRARIAGQLDTELGVTLLTYCYAYAGAPEIDALVFDPNFVRKHQFYPTLPGVNPQHTVTGIAHSEELGAFLTGSLSGLRYELCALATAQTVQSFGTGAGEDLVPTLLYSMRAVSPRLRSDRAQQYVALCAGLGREILGLSAVDDNLRDWVDRFLTALMSPARREKVEGLVNRRELRAAQSALSPSESMMMGKAYFELTQESLEGNNPLTDEATPPKMICPVLDHLREIVPKPDTPDAALFREEVDQYGVCLRRRIGLSQFSFTLIDPYEQLERSASRQIMDERICDLKIRLAELNYALGLPAFLAEFEAEPALHAILPEPSNTRISGWKAAVEQIQRLRPEDVKSWIEALTDQGSLGASAVSSSGR